jgi:hypothetical protein
MLDAPAAIRQQHHKRKPKRAQRRRFDELSDAVREIEDLFLMGCGLLCA